MGAPLEGGVALVAGATRGAERGTAVALGEARVGFSLSAEEASPLRRCQGHPLEISEAVGRSHDRGMP